MRGLAWNTLCDSATPLIGLVIRQRRLDQHDDVPALYLSASNQITTIMEEVSQLDYDAGNRVGGLGRIGTHTDCPVIYQPMTGGDATVPALHRFHYTKQVCTAMQV